MKSPSHSLIVIRSRRAFTLVELLVALVLVAIGLLALSATTALVMRELGAAVTRTAAGTALQNRVERFMLLPCAAAAGAVTSPHGVTESWSSVSAGAAAFLRDSVTLVDLRRHRGIVVEAARPCE